MLLIHNIAELVTFAPLVADKRYSRIGEDDIGSVKDAWMLVQGGKIIDYGGPDTPPKADPSMTTIDAEGGLVLPGLVDSHTHPIFAGDRSHEFAARLAGKTYQDIAAEGGGIRYTLDQSQGASDQDLLKSTTSNLTKFLSYGVTTVECKSGYGQTPEEEMRHLRLLRQAADLVPQQICCTYLGLHATPRGVTDKGQFIDQMTDLLTRVKEEDLAQWVDAFVENGYFSVGESERYFKKALELGLGIRIHADEFANSGAAKAAARWGAVSADHLEECSVEGRQAMISAGVVATLLPGTSIYSKIKFADGKAFVEAGGEVALATDFNPGSCLIHNLPYVATLGSLYCQLSPAAALAGVTLVAAKSMGLASSKGALAKGFDADFLIHPCGSKEKWFADFGQTKPGSVFIAGEKVP